MTRLWRQGPTCSLTFTPILVGPSQALPTHHDYYPIPTRSGYHTVADIGARATEDDPGLSVMVPCGQLLRPFSLRGDVIKKACAAEMRARAAAISS